MLQGGYLGITALWPLVDLNSFMMVTGYKADVWLVKTVSVLLLALTVIVFNVAFSAQPVPLSDSSAIIAGTTGLALVAFIYYFNGTIRWVYLVDAIIEMLFLTWWIVIFIRSVRKN